MIRPREPLPTRVSDTPHLPEPYARTLDAGLRELGLALSDEARIEIDGHARLLLAWTTAVNLTAIRDPVDVARLHVLDSLAAVALLRLRGVEQLIDLGSGGGYPGIPLAAALRARALLVESVGKKATFLETVVAATGLAGRVDVAPVRAESLGARVAATRATAVTARAVGSLADLVELAFPVLAPGGRLVAWKRGPIDDELAAAREAAGALGDGRVEVHSILPSVLSGHLLVEIEKRAPTPRGFPRDPAARRRRPWGTPLC
ncbi:MAG TPA: RsmG family class I SAM-dependent methyltransferase [Candidatus Limnocylindrales bacterium]|nr:RsmG family class I SAM-dependent methyltransferase [Candidatus Limnocylindrales bacterium]